ncbi:MAG: hypothetical protein EBR82_86375 [Caulobacteraceae bacterium]|nr:hypothetical protein [Caulobacteraceae bacterium]
MKKANKKKNICSITKHWPSVNDMKKDLFINLDDQTITKLYNKGKIAKQHIRTIKNSDKKYLCINIKRKTFQVHRLFFYWKYGFLPSLVDHIDNNSLNNNIENLRELDKSGNSFNSYKRKSAKPPTSKHKGVSYRPNRKKPWFSRICLNDKTHNIGYFLFEDDAGQAYNNKIRELGLEGICPLNDTHQERSRKINQFDPLPKEMNHIKNKFLNLEFMADLK